MAAGGLLDRLREAGLAESAAVRDYWVAGRGGEARYSPSAHFANPGDMHAPLCVGCM
jgi:hypothetical protein